MPRSEEEIRARDRLAKAKRVVIKIGSKSLAGDAWVRVAEDVHGLTQAGAKVVIVSSGAIAMGIQRLGMRARPKDMARLQAAAAAGQSALMQRWESAFEPLKLTVAQVLLTHADLADRTRTNNARDALEALLDANAIPIVNENDAVAVEEIRFGDNDQLASMVVPLVGADVLLLLSDVDGLLDDRGERIPFVRSVAKEAQQFAGQSKSGVGTGGMVSKIEAARRATLAGTSVVIAPARRPNVIRDVVKGEDIGTLFPARIGRINARKHWIAFTLRPRGALVLDRGAAEAVGKNKSILAVGVLGIRGTFQPGDSVSLFDPDGREIARGLVKLSAVDAARVCAKRSLDAPSPELVHRDDLVALPED